MTNIKDWQDKLLEDDNIPSNAKFVGIVLSRFFGKSKLIFPSLQTLSILTSNTILTIRKSLDILVESKYLIIEKESIKHQGGFKNIYKLYFEGEQVLKNNISNDILIDMLNHISTDVLINILKSNTEYNIYLSNIIEDNLSNLKKEKEKEINELKEKIKSLEKKENIKEKEKENFIGPTYQETFNKWIQYKKEKGQSYKSNTSLKTCYNNLVELSKNDFLIAEKIVNQSIANNWAGLFALKENTNSSKQLKTFDQQKIEDRNRVIMEIHDEIKNGEFGPNNFSF